MVKRFALVGAGVAAVLIAVSPLAFATESPTKKDGDKSVLGDTNSPSNQTGLVNLGDVNALNGLNVCPDVGVGAAVVGILGSDKRSTTACDALSGNNSG